MHELYLFILWFIFYVCICLRIFYVSRLPICTKCIASFLKCSHTLYITNHWTDSKIFQVEPWTISWLFSNQFSSDIWCRQYIILLALDTAPYWRNSMVQSYSCSTLCRDVDREGPRDQSAHRAPRSPVPFAAAAPYRYHSHCILYFLKLRTIHLTHDVIRVPFLWLKKSRRMAGDLQI